MAGAIVLLGKNEDRNPAPVQAYGSLYTALEGQISPFFVVNGGGEAIGPSTQINRDFSLPSRIAQFVVDGNVYIDYCGWPMYYSASGGGAVTTLGPSGFQQFASDLQYGWLKNVSFAFPTVFGASTTYPFSRGFPLNVLDGVCYNNGSGTSPGGLFGIGGGTIPFTADGYTAMMALHPPNGGWYFYGTYATLLGSTLPLSSIAGIEWGGVNPSDYAAFITGVVNDESNGDYLCQSYHLITQQPTTVTPGPSSPFSTGTGTGSGSGSGSGTSNSSPSTGEGSPTTRPTPTPNKTAEILAVSGMMGGIVVVGVVFYRAHQHGKITVPLLPQ